MSYRCIHCPKLITSDYMCEECMADIRVKSESAEKQARTVACFACHSPIGRPCLTSSGAQRGIAHATRKALAERAA